jgi:hypothetical protein
MANKTKATSQKEEAREKGPETPDAPLLLLDLSGAAVKKMIKQAKKRGYVTYEQLNAGGSRPTVFGNARANSADRGQGTAEAQAPKPIKGAQELPR